MRKIPTLFRRDLDDMRRVLPEVHPDCQWVLEGEGTPTRKYDGTCMLLADGWWARREVKPGKQPPSDFVVVETDPVTGKMVGWEPVEQSPFAKYHAEALLSAPAFRVVADFQPGTYELCGPKINGNPEHFPGHRLIRHADAEIFNLPQELDYERCRRAVLDLGEYGHEGIVWHHPDGRMAKIKRRDFPGGAP